MPKILAVALRSAHMISFGRSGALGKTKLNFSDEEIILKLPHELVDLAGERLVKRFSALAKLFKRGPKIIYGSKKLDVLSDL